MRILSVFIGLLVFSFDSYSENVHRHSSATHNVTQIAAGWAHTCALADQSVLCWGSNEYGQTDVPELINPTQVYAGYFHSCALTEQGVQCWGNNEYGQTDIPELINPTQVALGAYHTCALTEQGVQCWGSDFWAQSTTPELTNPSQIFADSYHTCALADGRLQCWGYNSAGQTLVPELMRPTQAALGFQHTCALSEQGVQCWGHNGYGQTTVPELTNPTQVAAGVVHTCALADEGVRCWGFNNYGQTNVPNLINPTAVVNGSHHTCALSAQGVQCWGANRYGQTDVPNELKAEFRFQNAINFIPVQSGTFIMGSPVSEEGRSDDEIQHIVTISKDFEIGATEVTQLQWFTVMGSNPSKFKEKLYCPENYMEIDGSSLCADFPVEKVSWNQVKEYIYKYNSITNDDYIYRLPTEAEWEYAARAGTTTAYWFGDDRSELTKYAWYSANSGWQTTDSTSKSPNPLGMYGIHGNVWEWVEDWMGEYSAEPVTDPSGPESGRVRVLRGGSWHAEARRIRSAWRSWAPPSQSDPYRGFRLVRVVE